MQSTYKITDQIGDHVLNHYEQQILGKTLCGKDKYIGMFFGAYWSQTGRNMTSYLIKFYNEVRKRCGDKLEIIYISSDRTRETCMNFYKIMPWLLMPYDSRNKKTEVSMKHNVKDLPAFIVISAETGEVVWRDGIKMVLNDEKGLRFPWLDEKMDTSDSTIKQ